MNSQVIVSGVPSRHEKKLGTPDRRLRESRCGTHVMTSPEVIFTICRRTAAYSFAAPHLKVPTNFFGMAVRRCTKTQVNNIK